MIVPKSTLSANQNSVQLFATVPIMKTHSYNKIKSQLQQLISIRLSRSFRAFVVLYDLVKVLERLDHPSLQLCAGSLLVIVVVLHNGMPTD